MGFVFCKVNIERGRAYCAANSENLLFKPSPLRDFGFEHSFRLGNVRDVRDRDLLV